MIEIDFTDLAVRTIGLAMVMVGLLILAERRRVSRSERRALRDRVVCRLCLAVFEARDRDSVQTCRECGASTDRKGPRPLG